MNITFTLGTTNGTNLVSLAQRGGIIPNVPRIEDLSQPNTAWKYHRGYVDPCKDCPNNPSNNPYANGFCCCALPSLLNPMF